MASSETPQPVEDRSFSDSASWNGLQSARSFIDVERPLVDADYARARACGCRVTLRGLSNLVHGAYISEHSNISLTFGRLFVAHPSSGLQEEVFKRMERRQLRRDELQPLANNIQVMHGGWLCELMQLAQRLNSSYNNTLRIVQCEMARMRGVCNQHPALSTPRRMLLAQLRFNMQNGPQTDSYKRSPSSIMSNLSTNPSTNPSTTNVRTAQDLTDATTGGHPLRYRDQRKIRRQKRRNVIFEKMRCDKRLLEQDDSLVEQALTPLEAVLLTYALIDQMIHDKVFVPWKKLTPSLLVDDLHILLSSLRQWKNHATGDALIGTQRTPVREGALAVELQRVERAIEVLERERGDMRTALHIASAAAWKRVAPLEESDPQVATTLLNGETPTSYIELSRLKPAVGSHALASGPPHGWLVSTHNGAGGAGGAAGAAGAGGAGGGMSICDEWPSFYKQTPQTSMSSNMSTSSYATSLSSVVSSASSISGISTMSGGSAHSAHSAHSAASVDSLRFLSFPQCMFPTVYACPIVRF